MCPPSPPGGLRPTVSWGGVVGVQNRGVAPTPRDVGPCCWQRTPPPEKHCLPVGSIFNSFLLLQLREATVQSKIFAAWCLTPALPVTHL